MKNTLVKAGVATLTVCTLVLAYDAATPETTNRPNADVTWSDPTPTRTLDEAAWRECVKTVEPTDANLQACDAEFGAWEWSK